jgi:hypothetical protein
MSLTLVRIRTLVVGATFAILLAHAQLAEAACSPTRVKRMASQGQTANSIARSCRMDREDVQEILDDAEEPDTSSSTEQDQRPGRSPQGLPTGAQLSGCGCWGYADGNGIPDQRCRSGMARPLMCPAMCPMGGYAWRGVCS